MDSEGRFPKLGTCFLASPSAGGLRICVWRGGGRVGAGDGFLCYSKRAEVTVPSFEQEAVMMLMVGLLGF